MQKHNRVWKRFAAVLMTGGMLLQVGPCTGDSVRNALGSGLRATLNGLFGVVTDSVVSDVFNLP